MDDPDRARMFGEFFAGNGAPLREERHDDVCRRRTEGSENPVQPFCDMTRPAPTAVVPRRGLHRETDGVPSNSVTESTCEG